MLFIVYDIMLTFAVEGYLNSVKEGITCQFETLQSQTQTETADREARVRTARIIETVYANSLIMYFIFA